MIDRARFDADRLVAEAVAAAGHDDFGGDHWRSGFELLLATLPDEARLNDVGVEMALGDLSGGLATRLGIQAWRTQHPEVAAAPIDRPIFIVGQPRTGTTILHDLMAQDPDLRAPLTWEIDRPLPPPQSAGHEADPRIDEVQAQLDMADLLIPGFSDFHPMGARLAQECVRITASDYASMIYPIQYRLPTYDRWLLHEADLGPTYEWHHTFLQHLQAAIPTPQWLLKSPAHLWHLDALAGRYPDAVVIQTHRDPLVVISSISALAAHLRRMGCDDPTVAEAAEQYVDDIFVGLDRGVDARDRGVLGADRFVDVQYRQFVTDPLATVEVIYDQLGRPLAGSTVDAMRAFLAAHPGDGGGGGSRYRFADTGLDADELRPRAQRYQARFGVESEPVR